jgi:hypothetical protein
MRKNSFKALEDVFDFLKTQEIIAILVSDISLYRKMKSVIELANHCELRK